MMKRMGKLLIHDDVVIKKKFVTHMEDDQMPVT